MDLFTEMAESDGLDIDELHPILWIKAAQGELSVNYALLHLDPKFPAISLPVLKKIEQMVQDGVEEAVQLDLKRTREAIEKHLDDEDLQVEVICRAVGLSRSHFHRKLKALTGQSATAFIRAHRLQRAADLLAGGYGNVTEVAFAVGFQSLSYFARCFREQYGVAPSEFSRGDR